MANEALKHCILHYSKQLIIQTKIPQPCSFYAIFCSPYKPIFLTPNLVRNVRRYFLAIIVPFTPSMSSNLWRGLSVLFGIGIKKKRFYTFMASSTLPWKNLWRSTWSIIDSPETEGRLLVALDDSINTKVGTKIFACEQVFDHAAKANQNDYPWAQNIVSVGLLKRVHSRWKIESGFKELRQNMGSQKSQSRTQT